MPFPSAVIKQALVNSRYCCCICTQFAGLDVNVHHIIQEAEKGANSLANAVVVCLRCHREVREYYDQRANDQQNIDRTYSPYQLKKHRDKWWEWCAQNPEVPLPINPTGLPSSSTRRKRS